MKIDLWKVQWRPENQKLWLEMLLNHVQDKPSHRCYQLPVHGSLCLGAGHPHLQNLLESHTQGQAAAVTARTRARVAAMAALSNRGPAWTPNALWQQAALEYRGSKRSQHWTFPWLVLSPLGWGSQVNSTCTFGTSGSISGRASYSWNSCHKASLTCIFLLYHLADIKALSYTSPWELLVWFPELPP